MGLIDTSMYGNYQAPDYAGNFMRGMQAGQQYRQNRQATQQQEQERKDAQRFEQTFRGLVQVNDITTPQGRMGLIQNLNQLGYGKQAIGLMGQFQEMAPKGPEYDFREGGDGLYATSKTDPTKSIKVPGFTPKPEKPTGTKKYQPVKNKAGKVVGWDAETGLGMDGKPVEFWQDPVSPSANRANTQQVIGLENQLRDEYEKAAAESRTIARAGQDIAAALNTNNSLSIGTAISKFSKLKDPTTGVLGGEADATEKAAMGDAWNRIQGAAQKTLSGGATPETIASFRAATKDLMRVQKEVFARTQERTKNRFGSYKQRFPDMNISLDAVMGAEGDRAKEMAAFDAFPEPQSPTAGPKPGTVEDGYRFKGGNPADPKNWEKL